MTDFDHEMPMDRKVRLAYERIMADLEATMAKQLGPFTLKEQLKTVKEAAEAMWGCPCEAEQGEPGIINIKVSLPTQRVTITLGGMEDE